MPKPLKPLPASGRRFVRTTADRAREWLTALLGGPVRVRIILILACVLALDAADKGTVGAVGPELRQSLGISNTELGALTAVSSGVGALAAIPVGMLTDRVNRVRLLSISIALWSGAMVLSGLAGSFLWLLLARLALGAVTATAGPTLASLIGDYFPASERGRIYGFILTGEMLGAGFGLVVGGDLAAMLSWRFAFWFLAVLGAGLLYVVVRLLPEPARGGRSRLRPGATSLEPPPGEEGEAAEAVPQRDELAQETVRRSDVEPDPDLVLRRDPGRMPIWAAVRYVLRIPTNRVMIVASAVGYFFFAGLRTFAVVFTTAHYGLSKATVSAFMLVIGVGAIAGVLVGGRLADHRMRRGHAAARVVLPAIAYIVAALLFAPAAATTAVPLAVPLFVLAAGALSAANPPLDAARLDVMHFRLWGRAESVRTFLRMGAEAVSPVVFGFVADELGGTGGRATGLEYAFLIMLLPLVANGVILLRGRRTYPRDVATAMASEEVTAATGGDDRSGHYD